MNRTDVNEARRVYMTPTASVWLPMMWAAVAAFSGGWIVGAGLAAWKSYQEGSPSTWKIALTLSGVIFAMAYTLGWQRWNRILDNIEDSYRPQEYGFVAEPSLTVYERPKNQGKTLAFDHIHATPPQLQSVAESVVAGIRPSFRNMTPIFGGSETAFARFRDDMAHDGYFALDEQNRVIVTDEGMDFFYAVLERNVTPLPHRPYTSESTSPTPHTRYTRNG